MGLAPTLFYGFSKIIQHQILSQHKLRNVVPLLTRIVSLFKRATNNRDVDKKPIMLFFPRTIFFHQLIAHVFTDALGSSVLLTHRIRTIHLVLDDFRRMKNSRVSPTMELHCSNCYKWKCYIRTPRPREVLFLLHLHRQVHRGLRALLPLLARKLVPIKAFPYPIAKSIKIALGKLVGKIWSFDSIGVDFEFGFKFKHD